MAYNPPAPHPPKKKKDSHYRLDSTNENILKMFDQRLLLKLDYSRLNSTSEKLYHSVEGFD